MKINEYNNIGVSIKLTDTCLIDRPFLNSNFLKMVPILCSLMVVMIHQHLIAGHPHSVSSRVISFFTHGVCTAAVPTFFLISGYLFYRNAYSFSDVFQKQLKRLKTVLMPFLAWSAFYYLMFATTDTVIPGFLESNVDIRLIGIIKGILFYEYAFPMWYMFQLCVFILLAPVLIVGLRNKLASILILVISAVLGLADCLDFTVDLGGYERSLFHVNYFAYYWLGCLLTRWQQMDKFILNLSRKLPWTILLGAFIGTGLMESLLFDEIIRSFNGRSIVPLVFISFLLIMVKLCHRLEEWAAPKVSTMVIYGVHSVVGAVVGKFIIPVLGLPAILEFVVRFALVAIFFCGSRNDYAIY